MFIDSAEIFVSAGNGGNGSVSFHREKYVASGGPDGGDGGHGGDVVLVADGSMSTLMDFKYKRKYKAQNGVDGAGAKCTGKCGETLYVRVPTGTIVKDKETGGVLADLSYDNQEFVVAKGGKGGFGNVHFATPTRQAPKFAKNGLKGQERTVILELKLLADVALIGFPNVGKSTLLSMVSKARPKIANYHFTTLVPNLGVVEVDSENSFVIADVPGLIEGAHEGVGLGHNFLRHIERTRLLLHIVDVSGIEGRNPIEDMDIINEELLEYNEKLASRCQIVVANKTDIITDPQLYEDFKKEVASRGLELFEISAATGKGVKELMKYVYGKLSEIPKTPLYSPDEIYVIEDNADDDQEDFVVFKENDVYCVEGPWVEKLVGRVNFDDSESLQYFQNSIRKKGIIEELEKKGIKEGDSVRMYDVEFDFVW